MTAPGRAFATVVVVLVTGVAACGSDEPNDERPPEPPSFLEPCYDENDCPEGLVCAAPILLETVCTMPCKTDSDCPRVAACWDRGYCDDFLTKSVQ